MGKKSWDHLLTTICGKQIHFSLSREIHFGAGRNLGISWLRVGWRGLQRVPFPLPPPAAPGPHAVHKRPHKYVFFVTNTDLRFITNTINGVNCVLSSLSLGFYSTNSLPKNCFIAVFFIFIVCILQLTYKMCLISVK